jgi:glutathione S-transferase
MYTLYYAPGAANMAPHAALEEIGAPYRLVKLDLQAGEHLRPDYLKLNPKGRVPTLTDGDYVLSESAAIILYLAERHPASGLVPQDAPTRGHFFQWLLYLTNTPQPAFLEYFYPDRWFEDAARQAALKAVAERRLGEMFAYLDESLAARGPYLLGASFSAADLFLHMLARWSRWLDKPAYRYPAIKRCADLVKARPAVQRMMQAEGLVEQEKAP